MTEFTVGPGVLEAMAAADPPDEPRSDEQYVILLEGNKVSQTWGRDGLYVWYESEGAVKRLSFRY